jgi:hypothetical protein
MAFREVAVTETREVLRAWLSGSGLRKVAEQAGVDRKTARRCGCSGVPDQDDRAVQLLVGSVQEASVVCLGEPLALVSAPGAVRAVDQPGSAAGPDGNQRGQ